MSIHELMQCQRELWAAQQALFRLQRKLATMKGWRASLAWECVERALEELIGQEMFDAWELPCIPPNFKHWRDKYDHDAM